MLNRNNPMKQKLNLGCGKDAQKRYVNLDKTKLPGVDIIHDLDKTPYPFEHDTFDEILCKHILEHTENLMIVMDEIHRIISSDGKIKIIAPYFSSHGAFNDPTHRRFFTYNTFDYLDQKDERHHYTARKMTVVKRKISFFTAKSFMKSRWYSLPFDTIINLAPTTYQRFFCWIFPAAEIHYLLKPQK